VTAPGAASAVADRAEVLLGAPFRVTIALQHDASQRYSLAAAQEPGPMAILRGACATRATATGGETRCDVELALFDLGTHSAVLRLDGSGAGATPVAVEATAVRALGVTDPATPAREIPLRGMPEPLPLFVPTWEPAAWVGLGVAVALALAVAVTRRAVARSRDAEERRRSRSEPVAPSEELEARLDALAAASRSDAGPSRWFELSRALRDYLAALSPPATLDRTTREVVAALRRAPIGGLDVDWFAEFATDLDAARFGGADPGPEAWRAALANARAILDTTRPPRWNPDEEARRG
jgi:hypothetical protein